MPGGKSIVVPNPLKDPVDFETRVPKETDVKSKLSHVLEAVIRIKQVILPSHWVPCGWVICLRRRGSSNT